VTIPIEASDRGVSFPFLVKKNAETRTSSSLQSIVKKNPEHLPTVQACWEACERFVLCATIALGLLQLIALKFSEFVWAHNVLYLRTQSRELPSDRTVKHVLTALPLCQDNCPSSKMASFKRSMRNLAHLSVKIVTKMAD